MAANVSVDVTVYAHRQHRQLLVLNITAVDRLPDKCAIELKLANCSITSFPDFNVSGAGRSDPGDLISATYTVKEMEEPVAGSTLPPVSPTVVGLAFQPVPPAVTLTARAPDLSFMAVFRTSLEPGVAAMKAQSTALQDLEKVVPLFAHIHTPHTTIATATTSTVTTAITFTTTTTTTPPQTSQTPQTP